MKATDKQKAPDPRDSRSPASMLTILFLALLVGSVLFSFNTSRTVATLSTQVSAALSQLSRMTFAGVFLTEDGWRPGDYAPRAELWTLAGESVRFDSVAAETDILYIAWDRCPICLEHLPEIDVAVSQIQSADLTFALIVLISDDEVLNIEPELELEVADIDQLRAQYDWDFPVYTTNRQTMLELNLQGTPTALVMRNGVLGEAFTIGTLQSMINRVVMAK